MPPVAAVIRCRSITAVGLAAASVRYWIGAIPRLPRPTTFKRHIAAAHPGFHLGDFFGFTFNSRCTGSSKREISTNVIRGATGLVKLAATKAQRQLFPSSIAVEAARDDSPDRARGELNVKPEEVAEMETRMSAADVALEVGRTRQSRNLPRSST